MTPLSPCLTDKTSRSPVQLQLMNLRLKILVFSIFVGFPR
ncbi:MAG: hypothetical protein ACJA1W_004773 [Akkermansiaceae bacterium]